MSEKEHPVYVRYAKLTPKGKELLDALMSIVENNIEFAAKGLDQMVEDIRNSEETQEIKK